MLDRRGAPITAAVFTSGAVLLGVEIAASRVLAPFFGNSLYVWGALIGVVLAGLAIGYWAGGALADRLPTPRLLVGIFGLGALAVLAVPLLDEHVLEAIVSWNPGPRLNPTLAAMILFGPPSVLLASVTPIAIRLRATAIARLGRTAGRLFSVSTFGSIAGTFVTAFWLVPELGTDQLLAIGAATLFAAAGVIAFAERLIVPLVVVLAALGGSVAVAVEIAPEAGGRLSEVAARNWSPAYRLRAAQGPRADLTGERIVYQKDTRYHRLAVIEDATSRTLRFDASFQSAVNLKDPFKTEFRYTDYFQLGLAYHPSARNVLFIGLGGGSAPKRFWRDFPSLQLQVAEIDPVVVDVAHRFFSVPKDPRLKIDVEDGRRYLAKTDRRWDVIALDAFYSDSIPFHMATQEFLELARTRLAPGGVIVTNVIGAEIGPASKLFRSLYRTYRTTFPTVAVHPVNEAFGDARESVKNLILVATDSPAPSRAFLTERWRALRQRVPTVPDLTSAIRNRTQQRIQTADVPVLTDDYAPTDSLLLN